MSYTEDALRCKALPTAYLMLLFPTGSATHRYSHLRFTILGDADVVVGGVGEVDGVIGEGVGNIGRF